MPPELSRNIQNQTRTEGVKPPTQPYLYIYIYKCVSYDFIYSYFIYIYIHYIWLQCYLTSMVHQNCCFHVLKYLLYLIQGHWLVGLFRPLCRNISGPPWVQVRWPTPISWFILDPLPDIWFIFCHGTCINYPTLYVTQEQELTRWCPHFINWPIVYSRNILHKCYI